MYNILLSLSRNIFFYDKIKLPDTFETRIYLMFMHFSVFLIISKQKHKKFDQKLYDHFFHNIENNLRELGFGDVSVNKKMKEFNKILYDILLKINLAKNVSDKFKINPELVFKYFNQLKDQNGDKFSDFKRYFSLFFHFCFEISLDNMVRDSIKFKI